jgi:hypothetical protein
MSSNYWNVLLAISNIPAIETYQLASKHNDHSTARYVALVAFMSFVSHLFQSHKHNQRGFGCPKHYSIWLNRLDLLGCFLLTCRLLFISRKKNLYRPKSFLSLLLCCTWNLVAEKLEPDVFAVAHSVWHISIFSWIHHWLTFVYET